MRDATNWSSEHARSAVFRYGVPFAAVALATALRVWVDPLLVWKAPFVFFALAILFSALCCGRVSGLTATLLSVLASAYLLLEPRFDFRAVEGADAANLLQFAMVGIAASFLGHQPRNRSARNRRREDRFRTIANTVPHFLWTAGPDGNCDFMNDRFYEYSGAEPAAVPGPGWFAYVHPDDMQDLHRFRTKIFGSGGDASGEFRIRRHDGVYRWFETRVVVSRDDSGRPAKWFGSNSEIQEARDLRERFAHIVATAPGAICQLVLRPDGSAALPFAGPALREIFDVNPADVAEDASLIFERIHPDDRARVREGIAESARTLSLLRLEYRVRNPVLGEIQVAVQSAPVREPDGTVSWFGFVWDVTDKKRADEVLRRQTEQELRLLRTLVERAPIGIVMLDRRMRHIQASQRWLDEIGLSRETLFSKTHYECFPDLPEHLKESHRRGLAGETVSGNNERIVTPDGEERWANWQVAPWGDSGERTGGIIIYGEDITERKRVEATARKTELQYRALFENMSEGIAYCRMIFEEDKPRDYIYLSVNDAFAPVSGLRNVEGKRMSEVFAGQPPIGSPMLELYGRVARTGVPEKLETYVDRLDQWVSASVYSPEKGFFVGIFDVITKRKQAELAARQWQRAFSQSESGIALCNAVTNEIEEANAAYSHMLGYMPEELVGRPSTCLYPSDELANREAAVQTAESEVGHALFESRHVRKDGSQIPVLVDITAVRDEMGRVISRVNIVHDLTENKRAEAVLRESEQTVRALLDSAAQAILAVDREGRIVLANRMAGEMFGYGKDELLGQPLALLLPEDVAGMRRDGTSFPAEVSLSHVETQQGSMSIAFVSDITERERAERDLRLSEERFRRLFEADIIGIVISDGRDIFESNDQFLRMLGYTREEFFARRMTWREITPPEIMDVSERGARSILSTGVCPAFEKEYIRKDGTRVPVLFTAVDLHRPGESSHLCFVVDLTERKNLENQFRQAQKLEMIGQLAGGVAHDFNNLLTVVLGYSAMILSRIGPDHPFRSALEQISAAGNRATGLTRQLLTFSRQNQAAPADIPLDAVVPGISNMLQRLIGEQIEMIVSAGAEAGFIHADTGLIEQVIVNLAVNARDAMPEGGQLIIETACITVNDEFASLCLSVPQGAYVSLQVTDTGTGMTHEVQARLFEPFFTTKEPGKGTGLGLSTVYGIVKQCGGFITVHSSPGIGSTFRILFPAVGALERPMAPQPERIPVGGTETLLLVEDQTAVRNYIGEVLKEHGYRVLKAANGMEAVEVSARYGGRIDLLLTDIVMPGMSASEMILQFLALRPGTPVLRMSGYPERLGAQLNDGTPYLQKPIMPQVLLARIRKVLENESEISNYRGRLEAFG